MKSVVFLVIFLAALGAHAATGESHFHLLDTKCEAEASDGVESTAQSPPLDVDDPGTPGCNKWEINVLVNGDITKNEKDFNLPLLDLNYGIVNNLQLKYELPFLNKQTEDGSASATGSSKAGVKVKFYENEESKTQLAFYPQVEFSNQNAVEKGMESKGSITTLPLLLSTKLGENSKGDIALTVNLGYNILTKEDVTNFVSAAAGVGVPLNTKTIIMGELSTEQSLLKNSDNVRGQLIKTNLGCLSMVTKWLLVYGSVGKSLYATDEQDHTYVLAGLRVLTEGMSK